MVENDGFIPLQPQRTKFKFKEGVHQLGTSRCEAGASVSMGWNQAILAQGQGWGEVNLGQRPHHRRPHLLNERQPPRQWLLPSDGLTATQRAEARLHASVAPEPEEVSAKAAPRLSVEMPLRLMPSIAKRGRLRRNAMDPWGGVEEFWIALHKDLKEVWRKAPNSPMPIANTAVFAGEVGRWSDRDGKPHGLGALLLQDMQHLGSFRDGRADGEGVCFSSNGSLWQGRWVMNLRVGEFVCLDSQGKIWLEEYDNKGKRLARQLHGTPDCKDAAREAVRCEQCGWLHHPQFNHEFACQKHRGAATAGVGHSECLERQISAISPRKFSAHATC
ncbi:unnamed protein product [Symbiodinium sp. CCMP2592]|nr:unnamed protein product [Symbiodinium sp. CCMP2592]